MSNARSFLLEPERGTAGWRPSLFDAGTPAFDEGFGRCRRRELPPDAWVDHAPGWLAGSAELFDALVERLGWSGRTVPMYGDLVDQPRLTAVWPGPGAAPGTDPTIRDVVESMRRSLSTRYAVEFSSVGFNLYRDGDDSVAWHGDRIARDRTRATIAIVSVGEPRPFRLRPKGGGPSIGYALGGGDLLVMGGGCQRSWQHCVPKVHRAGPRISITFRHGLR